MCRTQVPESDVRCRRTVLRGVARFVLILLLSTCIQPRADAQALRTEPVFGIGDNEFLIGGWNIPLSDTGSYTERAERAIAWARDMGVNVFRLQTDYKWNATELFAPIDALLDAADATSDIRFFMVPTGMPASSPAYGLEAKFYFVPDSVPFKDWPCKFLYLDQGTTYTNQIEDDDWKARAKEQRYHRDSVAANTRIADSIVIDWRPERTHWWSHYYRDGNFCRVPIREQQRVWDRLFGAFWSPFDKAANAWTDTTYVVVTGHLENEQTPAPSDSTVLWIDLFYDIDHDENYFDSLLKVVTRDEMKSVLCTTFVVKRGDLNRKNDDESWDKYQSVSLPFDARICTDEIGGPLSRPNVSRKLNLRVRYAGNATIALRSVALRDQRANDALEATQVGVDAWNGFRELLAARALTTNDVPRRSVIGFALDGEQSPIQSAAVHRFNRELQEGYELADPRNPEPSHPEGRPDTLNLWLEGLYREGTAHQLSTPETPGRLTMVAPEFSSVQDRRSPWTAWTMELSEFDRGAIREHNGGRFQLRELTLDSVDIERFERAVQILHLRQYLPAAPEGFPLQTYVAEVARLARDQRKRLISIPFASNNLWYHTSRTFEPTAHADSIGCDRILEPAELRNAGNVSIALGATGVFWQVLTLGTNFLQYDPGLDTWHGVMLDFPICGGDGETQDYFTDFPLRDATGAVQGVLPGEFYTGWGVRSRGVRQYNQWLDTIGPELMKLSWRDAYSMHAHAPIRYRWDELAQCYPDENSVTHIRAMTMPRPLPESEIITKVTTRSPSGRIDADSATYVELGLFDIQTGTRNGIPDPMLDVHHAWICNRRVFEPSDELAAGPRRDSMVALAGTREIGVKLNLMKTDEFVFCRVREIIPDLSPLPGMTAARIPLDTIIPADSIFTLRLGPGRASLVRISYVQWDTNIIAGRLQFPNQRKIVWDPWQRRYHCVYMKGSDTSRIDSVCYRRSWRMYDETGSILWEPGEHVLSIRQSDRLDSMVSNRHPSITIRRAPAGVTENGSATTVSVVWSAHRIKINFPARQILQRTIKSPDTPIPLSLDDVVEVIDSAVFGDPANRWGTPVVSRLDGCDVIAWSDSINGIEASARMIAKLSQGSLWWRGPAPHTAVVKLANDLGRASDDSRGRYPSVPTFAHIASQDSNVAIVWEQPVDSWIGGDRCSDIYYSRLHHLQSNGSDTLVVVNLSRVVVSNAPGVHRNPSMSQHQDTWHRVQDVVAWESFPDLPPHFMGHVLNARSVFTETRTMNPGGQPDIIGSPPQLWGWAMWYRLVEPIRWLYPNVASIAYEDSSGGRGASSTIVVKDWPWGLDDGRTLEFTFPWADVSLRAPRQYLFNGGFPTNSETPGEQGTRHVLLYESLGEPVTVLRTSRQFFFAKARPTGYVAEGRVLSLRLRDSAVCGLNYLMSDPWIASGTTSAPVAMAVRDTTLRTISTLPAAVGLLRTDTFTASDSTWLGLSLSARYVGDTLAFQGAAATYVVELVSATTLLRVALLDSFRIDAGQTTHMVEILDSLDLLSDTYFVRTTIDTVGISVPATAYDSRYPIGELRYEVEDDHPALKVRRLAGNERADLRVTAHPNPTTAGAEANFTVPEDGRVRVIISDHDGRFAETLLDEWMQKGRYALDVDMSRLRPGRYVIQVRVGNDAGITKILIQR